MKVDRWELLIEEPYARKSDDKEVTLLVWVSTCCECGRTITAKTPKDFSTSNALKAARCTEHAKKYTQFSARSGTKDSTLKPLKHP